MQGVAKFIAYVISLQALRSNRESDRYQEYKAFGICFFSLCGGVFLTGSGLPGKGAEYGIRRAGKHKEFSPG